MCLQIVWCSVCIYRSVCEEVSLEERRGVFGGMEGYLCLCMACISGKG